MINQQILIYKDVQSHIMILHQPVSVTLVTIIRAAYNKNIKIQVNVQKCMIKPLGVTYL